MTVAGDTQRAPSLDPGAATLIPLAATASCAIVLDGEGRVIAISAAGTCEGAAAAGPAVIGESYLALCEAAVAAGSGCSGDVARALREVLAGRRDEPSIEYRCRVRGEERWWSARIVRLEGSGAARVLIAHEDVTERKPGAFRALEDELRRQALVFETIYDAIILMDLDSRILDWNPAAERIFGFSRAEMLGRTPDAFHHPSVGGALDRAIRATLARDGRWAGEVPFLRKDGHSGVADTIIVVQHDREGLAVGLLGVNRDVTERRLIEEALRASEEQLRQAQKMEAVGRLAGGIAHDFNNLLAAIKINCELLLDELGPTHPGRADAAEIRHAAARGASLTRQLLAFSRKQVMQPRVLDLNTVVAGVEQMLRRIIGEDVELDTALDPALGCVRADPGQLEQVLVNLAVNARDAMPVGGRLSIHTAGAVLDAEAARQHAVAAGRYAVLAVSDTGLGMDEATRAHVFEPFFTTKEPGKGTGLGLSTVYGIVRQSGGFVQVASALGRGTTFRICLPWVTESAERDGAHPALGALPRGTETVLVVEDEDAIRASVLRVLRRCGYATLEARNGIEALRVCRGHGGAIDLVLTDIVMPEMGGRELAERVTAERAGARVLFMSGYTDGALDRHGRFASDAAFIAKPFTMNALATAVREAIDGARR